jgi:flagellin
MDAAVFQDTKEDFTMVIVGNTNQATVGYWYNMNNAKLATSMERLSSGLKINHPIDDPVGDALNQNTLNYMAGLQQASTSEQNAITYLNTLDGWYQNVNQTMDQMQQVAVRMDDPTLNTMDKFNLASQFNNLATQVNNVMTGSIFNNMSWYGTPNISGGTVSGSVVGTDKQGPFTQTRIVAMDGTGTTMAMNPLGTIAGAEFKTIGIALLNAAVVAGIPGSGATIGQMIASFTPLISNSRATIGAYEVEIQAAYNNNQVTYNNMQAVSTNVSSTDIAAESQKLAQYQILTQSSMAMMTQVNTSMLNVLQLLR